MPIFYVLYFPKLVLVPCFLKIFASVPLFPENKWACSIVPKTPWRASLKIPLPRQNRLFRDYMYCIVSFWYVTMPSWLFLNKSICLSVNMSKLWDEWQTMQSLIGLAAFDLVLDCLLRSFYPHYENTPVQICKIFTSKNWKISDKILWYFSYFWSKHRLWVLVRTASARRF